MNQYFQNQKLNLIYLINVQKETCDLTLGKYVISIEDKSGFFLGALRCQTNINIDGNPISRI